MIERNHRQLPIITLAGRRGQNCFAKIYINSRFLTQKYSERNNLGPYEGKTGACLDFHDNLASEH